MSWKQCPECVRGTCLFGKANMQGRTNHKGHRGFHPWGEGLLSKECLEMPMKRPDAGVNGRTAAQPDECDLAIKLPSLWEFLVEDKWDDGKKRTPGTLLIFTEDGWFKGMLNDKDLSRIAFDSSETLLGLLQDLDLGLRDSHLDWRKSKPFKR